MGNKLTWKFRLRFTKFSVVGTKIKENYFKIFRKLAYASR